MGMVFFGASLGQFEGGGEGRRAEMVPAMFIFGDSLIDNGNNNNLPSFAKANYFPYGIDFNGGPTGRFSNGYTMVDEIGMCNCMLYNDSTIIPFQGITKMLACSGAAGTSISPCLLSSFRSTVSPWSQLRVRCCRHS